VRVAHRRHGGIGEAQDELKKFQADLLMENEAPAPPAHTFGNCFDAYIEFVKDGGGSQSTVTSYRSVAKRIPEDLKAKDVNEVTTHDLDSWYVALRRAGRAPSTIRHNAQVVSIVLRQAQRWKWLTGPNPAEEVRRVKPVEVDRPRLEARDVWSLFAAAAAKEDVVLAVTIVLAAIIGCRRGELCGLMWSDIDAETASIRVERQWIPGEGGQYLTASTKTKKARTVYLGHELMGLLERYRDHQHDLLGLEPDGWLLSYDGGTTPMRAKSVTEHISQLSKRVGYKGITPHSFRRMTVDELVAANVDVATGAGRMGHTPEVMMQKYVKGRDDKAKEAGQVLEARLIDQGLPIGELLAGG
jgi:integrase